MLIDCSEKSVHGLADGLDPCGPRWIKKNVKHTRGLGSVSKQKAGRLLTSNCSKEDEGEGKKTFSKLFSDDKQYRLAKCCTHCNWESLTDRMTSSRESQRLEARLRKRAITTSLDHVMRASPLLLYRTFPKQSSSRCISRLLTLVASHSLRPSAFSSWSLLEHVVPEVDPVYQLSSCLAIEPLSLQVHIVRHEAGSLLPTSTRLRLQTGKSEPLLASDKPTARFSYDNVRSSSARITALSDCFRLQVGLARC